MRLWTAMLGAWLAAGTGTAEAPKASGAVRATAMTKPQPVAECRLAEDVRGEEAPRARRDADRA